MCLTNEILCAIEVSYIIMHCRCLKPMGHDLYFKVCANGRRSQERMLFLFSDIFMYAKVDTFGNYTACNIIPLHKCHVSAVKIDHSMNEKSRCAGGLFRVSTTP